MPLTSHSTAFVTRFAPSPTGLLHLGHAYSALTAFNAARAARGRFILRIEDIDQTRCRSEFEQAIFEDLAWLGITWETPVRRQSSHFDHYERALKRLRDIGVVYRCFKTRKEVLDEIARAPHMSANGPDGPRYTGEALPANEEHERLDQGAPFAWRLSMIMAKKYLGPTYDALSFIEENEVGVATSIKADPGLFGDAVIARKDSSTSYHLASVHDDALQGVTHIIRGVDLKTAAHLHRLLQALLDYPAPVYRHHRLITGGDGKRLAKRDKSATLRAMRENGATPNDIIAQLSF